MTCERCHAGFEPRKTWQRFCCERCQDAALKAKHASAFDRPFVAFDGEGWHGRYTILADSTGRQIASRAGLSTQDCLEWLLRSPKQVANVWFGFGYDVNMMLGDLPLFGEKSSLEYLQREGDVYWGDYYIRYLPRKQLTISDRKGRTFNSYDTLGFFQTNFEKTLELWIGEIPELIAWGKSNRDRFDEIALEPGGFNKIGAYNALECELLVEIMTRMRDALRIADLRVSRWDGAGAIAAAWLRRNRVDRYYGAWPSGMDLAVSSSFFGGNINVLGIGRADLTSSDIRSAYPANVARCPDLSQTSWHYERGSKLPIVDYAICRVSWDVDHDWPPLPYRRPSGSILYPPQGCGWYYACEAAAAKERFGRRVSIEGSWIPDAEAPRPLGSTILTDYEQRASWKREGNPAEIVSKFGLNAIYGKLAQTLGWNDRKPRFQNMLWAGYVTAKTRAQVQLALLKAKTVYAISTDGILADADLELSDELGGWSRDDVVRADILGAGLYQTYFADGSVNKHKQRGFSDEPLSYAATLERWLGGSPDPEPITVRRFVGMGMALAQGAWTDSFRQFVTIDRDLANPLLEGTSKRLPERLGSHGSFVRLDPRPAPDPATPSAPYRKLAWEYSPEWECAE